MRRRAVDRSVGKHATIGCFSWASTDRRPPGSAPERVRGSAPAVSWRRQVRGV